MDPVRKDFRSRQIPQPQEWQECVADDVICDPVADISSDGSEAAQTDLVIRGPVAAVNDDMTLLCEDTRLSRYLTDTLHALQTHDGSTGEDNCIWYFADHGTHIIA